MPSIILSNLIVTVSLIILVSISFSLSYAQLASYYKFISQDALIKDLIKINNAINYVYGRLGTAITVKLVLPPGSTVTFYPNGTIYFSPSLDKYTLRNFIEDPNGLINVINSDSITYKIKFQTQLTLFNKIEYVSLKCDRPFYVEISNTF